MRQIFEKNGFKVFAVFPVKNYMSVNYLLRLMPLPLGLKKWLQSFIKLAKLDQRLLRLRIGNLGIIAQK